MYLNRIQKEAAMVGMLRSPELRKVPLEVLTRMRRFIAGEKFTRLSDGRTVVNSFLPPLGTPAFDSLGKGLNALLEQRVIPVSAYVSVTDRCNYHCWHCSREHRCCDDMSREELLRVVGELQELGVGIVGFTGGEPLLRDDLEDAIAAVDERSATVLFTSGDGFDARRAGALKDAGLFAAAVSLDHYRPEVHDQRRGKKGAYDSAIQALQESLWHGFYTMIQLVATKDVVTGDTIDRYLELAERLGVHEIRLLEPMPTGKLLENSSDCMLSPSERDRLKQLHLRTNRRRALTKVNAFAHIEDAGMYGCGAGFQHMYIDASGNVCPCDFVPVSFGNVRKEPVAQVWQRLRAAFKHPRRKCFLMEYADTLREAFKGALPLPCGELEGRCAFCKEGELPAYYEALGWGSKRQPVAADITSVEPCSRAVLAAG